MYAAICGDGNGDWSQRWKMAHDAPNEHFEFGVRTKDCDGYRPAYFATSSTTPVKGGTYFLAGTYNQSNGLVSLYINGQPERRVTGDKSGLVSSVTAVWKGSPCGITWNGAANQKKFSGTVWKMDTVERCLSDQEVVSGYMSGP